MQRLRTRRTYAADIVTVALLKLDRTFCIYSRAVFEPDCNMDVGVRQPITTQRASLPNDGPAPATASRRMTALPRATGPSSPTIIAGSFPQQRLSAEWPSNGSWQRQIWCDTGTLCCCRRPSITGPPALLSSSTVNRRLVGSVSSPSAVRTSLTGMYATTAYRDLCSRLIKRVIYDKVYSS